MKQTDIMRKEREMKKSQKKIEKMDRPIKKENPSVGDYINDLTALFFFDKTKIYNIDQEEKILELLEEMKQVLPEKQWDNVIKKAIKKTGVKQKDLAVEQLSGLLGI